VILGIHLLFALFAGAAYWAVAWLCGRLGAAGWLAAILSFAAGVYVFWWLNTLGPITIGR